MCQSLIAVAMFSAAHSGSLDKEAELEAAPVAFYANFYDDIATPMSYCAFWAD